MGKVKLWKKRSWMIPVRFTMDGTVFVNAATEEEALKKFEDGDWEEEDQGECNDIERRGKPILNE